MIPLLKMIYAYNPTICGRGLYTPVRDVTWVQFAPVRVHGAMLWSWFKIRTGVYDLHRFLPP